MDDSTFDVIIIGTGLTESITVAALAKAGFKVAHLDENSYYGGNEASLSLDELAQWVDAQPTSSTKYTSVSRSAPLPPQARQYSICLAPSVIPSIGPTISALVSSGVAKYGGFRLLERAGVYSPSGAIKNVPGTKEDVFTSKDISLVDKRRLMRFLMFAVGDFEDKKELEGAHDTPFSDFLQRVFSLKGDIQAALVFALAFCFTLSDPTLPALNRIRRYLRSAGRYGPSPFLLGHYGGTGEIAQGFCRAAAVSGGVYILGRCILSVTHSSTTTEAHYSVMLDDFPDTLTSTVLISSASHVPPDLSHLTTSPAATESIHSSTPVARCIAIVDQGISFPTTTTPTPDDDADEAGDAETSPAKPPSPLDAGILVFPPSSVPGGSTSTAATVLVTGEGTMSTPRGKWIWYIALPMPDSPASPTSASAQDLLQPYLDATLALTSPPHPTSSEPNPTPQTPPTPPHDGPSEPPPPTPPKPLFTAFYIEHPSPSGPTPPAPATALPPQMTASAPRGTYILVPPLAPACALPELPDAAATHAEAVFWEAVRALRDAGVRPKGARSAREGEGTGEEDADADVDVDVDADVESFWPPLDSGDGDESGQEEW
ncbi:hypothetical protein H0H81_000600 [Sphagnurus paluster]|uniref:Rab proteins geranylgeranyltransferase component A n=1 Tax=Sphagnurus paluster TaxID=117069 RepID=A0A9P7GNE2_9AGAR|nr:hypothetical protein H0H81_000600 [Sphagnurus paluster]